MPKNKCINYSFVDYISNSKFNLFIAETLQ